MDANKVGVHVQHCCLLHGCKYHQTEECPVETGELKQAYRCEYCDMDWESNDKPECSALTCTHPGYWKWRGVARGTGIAFVGLEVYYYFCDGHDKWHREAAPGGFHGKPEEKRVL
jgi:hypothetical protein